MISTKSLKWIRPATELNDALRDIDCHGVNQLPVKYGDQLQGVPGRDNVIGLLRMMMEFSRQKNPKLEV